MRLCDLDDEGNCTEETESRLIEVLDIIMLSGETNKTT